MGLLLAHLVGPGDGLCVDAGALEGPSTVGGPQLLSRVHHSWDVKSAPRAEIVADPSRELLNHEPILDCTGFEAAKCAPQAAFHGRYDLPRPIRRPQSGRKSLCDPPPAARTSPGGQKGKAIRTGVRPARSSPRFGHFFLPERGGGGAWAGPLISRIGANKYILCKFHHGIPR
jgi:hypothetical protein